MLVNNIIWIFFFAENTAQSQSMFYARGLRSVVGDNAYNTGDRLIYQTPLHNPGNNYNSTSGEYTCPTTGVYLFVYSVHGHAIAPGACLTASLYRGVDFISKVYYANELTHRSYLTMSHTDIVYCSSGQKVWIQSDNIMNYIRSFPAQNIFGGVLLYTL